MGLVAIFGAGVMGETLLSGLLRAGRPAADRVVTEKRADRAAELRAKHGVEVLSNVEAAAREALASGYPNAAWFARSLREHGIA